MCKKIPKTYQNLVCGRGSNSFSPLRATNLKLHVTSCHIFRLRLNTLKGTVIILTVLILDLSTLSVTNVHTPPPRLIGTTITPRHFYIGALVLRFAGLTLTTVNVTLQPKLYKYTLSLSLFFRITKNFNV